MRESHGYMIILLFAVVVKLFLRFNSFCNDVLLVFRLNLGASWYSVALRKLTRCCIEEEYVEFFFLMLK